MNWKKILGAVAPILGTALGGPFGGIAMKTLSGALLGKEGASESEIAEAVASANPETLLKLKEADQAFATQMRQLDVDVEKIAAEDRASAREREKVTGDPTTRRLAYIALVGFFLVLAAQLVMAFTGRRVDEGIQRTLDITTGVLFAWVLAVKDYYFGSSAGSASKSKTIEELTKK